MKTRNLRVFHQALSAILSLSLCPLLAHSSDLPVPDRARYVFQRVGDDLGIATITPVRLFQDREGFIWIASMSGLLRYDGSRVVKFGPEQGAPSGVVAVIDQDGDGRIWVASRHELAGFDGSRFTPLPLPQSVQSLAQYQAIAVRQNRLYLATDNGIWMLSADDQSLSWVAKQQIFPGKQIELVYTSKDDKVWFSLRGRLGWLDGEIRPHFLQSQKGISKEPMIALLQDGKRRLWLRTARHLVRLDPGSEEFVPDPPNLPGANDVGFPSLDRKGRLLIPTVAGLFLHRGDHWESVDKKRGIATNAVFSAMEDREGTFWLGLGGNGIERWEGQSIWSGWTDAEGLPDNVVWAELRDRQQRLWLGTNNGVAMWDPNRRRFRVWRETNGLNGSTVRQLTLAGDGAVWALSHPGGLTRFDPQTLQAQKVTLPHTELDALGQGPDGRLWVAAPHCLKGLRSTSPPFVFDNITAPQGVVNDTNGFAVSSDGVLWTSGQSGLGRYDGKTWAQYTSQDGLLSSGLSQVLAVSASEAWVRYADAPGVTRFQLQGSVPEVKHFGKKEGLTSDDVFMLGLDASGGVWAGGSQGLARIAPDGTIRRYRHNDGLLWDDQSEGGFFADRDGTVLFGTSGGLARFDPRAEAGLPPVSFSVVLTSAQLGGQERLAEIRPEANHRQNILHAEFAALSYRDPADIRCRYRLHGLEGEFTETLSREVRYAALPPGDYALEISCSSGNGALGRAALFSFHVLPAWWQRWWACDLEIFLVGLFLYGILRLRTYALEKDRLRLEKAVAERSAELERLNQELRDASLTDPLTGARNRRFFQVTVEGDVRQAVRSFQNDRGDIRGRNRDLVFYIIDVDHFKEVNDIHGHAAGDELLSEMTKRIQSAIRMSDILVRWGGEEFLVVSRYTERAEAATLASRVLRAIGKEPFRLKSAPEPLRRTCSVGWAAFPWFCNAPEVVPYEMVVELADRGLYAAKQGGRNRAVGVLAVEADLAARDLSAEKLRATQTTVLGPEEAARSAGA
jgi:diguanylate cyclase (GGDEF)-like protein